MQRWFKEHLVELCLEDYHTLDPFSAGADLVDILRSAGFEVQLEESLLKKSRSEHLKHFTYPMRIFRLSKPS